MAQSRYATQVALGAYSDPAEVSAAIRAEIEQFGSVTITVRVEDRLPDAVVSAAVDASSSSSDVLLYVLGYDGDPDAKVLSEFRSVAHVNVNVRSSTKFEFLSDFTELRSLTIQASSTRKLPLGFLAGMQSLTRLSIPGSVTATNALGACEQLQYLQCSSNPAVLAALADHHSLRYLDVSFGSCRDLRTLATISTLRGVALYRVAGLDGDDLEPLSECASLRALSLGAMKHVTHLGALTGQRSLHALLLEKLPNIRNLEGLAGCENLEQLGLYESRPEDRSLEPLRELRKLAHLVLGDPYPAAQIEYLKTWYAGSLRYRGDGPADFKPRWRTPIERLDDSATD